MRTTRNSAGEMGILKQLADNAMENVHASVSERAANRRSLAQDRKVAKQEMKLEGLQAEQQKYNDFIESIHSIEFDPSDIEGITTGLAKLMVIIDDLSAYRISDNEKIDYRSLTESVKQKFSTGVAILQSVDPTNALLPVYKQRLVAQEMAKKEEDVKRKKVLKIGGFVFLAFILLILLLQMCA